MLSSSQITVLIPAYNAEAYLKDAVMSVRAQTIGGGAEILLADDGSADKTSAAAQSLGLCPLSLPHRGAAAARNALIPLVKTEFLAFLDADDMLLPQAFASLSAPFEKDPSLCAVFALAEDFVSPELTAEQRAALAPRPEPYSGILPGCSLLRTGAVREIGLFNEQLSPGEVVDWLLRLRSSGLPTASIPAVTLRRRLHLSNSGRVLRTDEAKNYAAILRRNILRHGE